jgi:HEPN domain-containing protein
MNIEFDVEKTVTYWMDGAAYDLGVAEAMLLAEKYPYALFMGHLALEKLLKSLVVKKTRAHAPITHSLPLLVEKAGIAVPEQILIKLREFMEYHIDARYPRSGNALYTRYTGIFTKEKLKEIQEVYQWLKAQF